MTNTFKDVEGLVAWFRTLNKKQQKIVLFLLENPVIKDNLKSIGTIQEFLVKLQQLDADKMFKVVPIHDVDDILDSKEFLDDHFNENETVVGFKKLVKLNNKLVVVYTNNKLNVQGKVYNDIFAKGRYWIGMTN